MHEPSGKAVRLLARVFARLDVPLPVRLWDGTSATLGAPGESRFAVVFRSPRALRRLLRRPTPLRFGEAFIDGEIDIEGDLFAAMATADHVERLRVPLGTKLGVLAGLIGL